MGARSFPSSGEQYNELIYRGRVMQSERSHTMLFECATKKSTESFMKCALARPLSTSSLLNDKERCEASGECFYSNSEHSWSCTGKRPLSRETMREVSISICMCEHLHKHIYDAPLQ